MNVRLTRSQASRIRQIIAKRPQESERDRSNAEAFNEWFGKDVHAASAGRLDVLMPAVAWLWVERVLFEHCFDHRGFRRRETKVTATNALKSVRSALNAREQHPALRQQGAFGFVNELVPAWKFPGPDGSGKLYSPYPVDGMPYVVLGPVALEKERDRRLTMWAEADLGRLPLWDVLDESEHWRFNP